MKLIREQIIEAALNLPEADQVALADAIYLNTKGKPGIVQGMGR